MTINCINLVWLRLIILVNSTTSEPVAEYPQRFRQLDKWFARCFSGNRQNTSFYVGLAQILRRCSNTPRNLGQRESCWVFRWFILHVNRLTTASTWL